MGTEVAGLTRLINNEIIQAMGLSVDSWIGRKLQPILAHAARRFCEIFAEADRIVGAQGVVEGARFVLSELVTDVLTQGADHIPREGPLVISANHPGTVDSVALAAAAGREDLKIMASAVPFLRALKNIRTHLILLPRLDLQCRMLAAREAMRHVRSGGALLLFARGRIDPDPAFMVEAEQELAGWSRSVELFLRQIPETRIVTSIVSHVIEPGYMQHPLTRLRASRQDRQKLAMMIQIIQQMLGRPLDIVPRVSFGEAITAPPDGCGAQQLATIISSAKTLMEVHLTWRAPAPI
jgi:hypothetical protein